MNKGSIILLLLLAINIVGFGFASVCTSAGQSCGSNFDNSVISFFFDVDENTDLTIPDGIQVDETFRATMQESLVQETGVATAVLNGVVGFLDSLKMVLAFLSLLTPFPLLVLMYSFGIPLLYMMLFSIPLFVFYALAIIEIIRGVQF